MNVPDSPGRRPLLCIASATLTLVFVVAMSSCGLTPNGDGDLTIWDEVAVGSLVVTEILANPNVSRPEFVEIQNASASTVNLQGCQVADGGSSAHEFLLNAPINLEPGQRALLSGDEYLGAAEGEIVPDAIWDGIVLNQNDEAESFSISCPDGIGGRQMIDTVTFDWGAIGVARGRSWQLAVEPADATANDDPANWCAAPAQDDTTYAVFEGVPDFGSPGAATTCESLGGLAPAAAGDVVISELLIHDIDGMSEWFELHNPGSETVDVRNCILSDETLDPPSDPNLHTINYEDGETVIEPGGFLLFGRTDTGITDDGSLVADQSYSGMNFNNSNLQRLSIDCTVGASLVRIDEVTYNWEDWGSTFAGQSLSLSSDSLDSESNDNPANWCMGSTSYYTNTNDPPESAYGSPGEANPQCEAGPYPAVGELVITELLIAAIGTDVREWIEVYNSGSSEVDLFGCELVSSFVSEVSDTSLQNDHRISPEGGVTTIAAGGYLLLSKTETSVTSGGVGTDVVADYAYGSITLSNSEAQYLWIECPVASVLTEIDRIEFDWGGDYSTDDKGSSLSLNSNTYTATDNDLSSNWCLAQSSDLYYSITTTDDNGAVVTHEATGTPGTGNGPCI